MTTYPILSCLSGTAIVFSLTSLHLRVSISRLMCVHQLPLTVFIVSYGDMFGSWIEEYTWAGGGRAGGQEGKLGGKACN
ncbi:hypothetical protein EYC84_007845 [Monilinia fructicola]|uniref:Uncharacterized protein n=1 Tax=Monilinia fructicola TaxID=38448 RepID=A0A5M9JM81_MONFR|nr:hypothetical protein EYC84_007845 [Monilinia fructicola]